LDTTDTTNAAGTRFGTSNDRELVSWKSVALLVEHEYELRNQKCSCLYALRKAVRSGGDRTPVLRQHTTSFVKPHVVSLNSRFLLARFFQHGHGMPMRTAATAPLSPPESTRNTGLARTQVVRVGTCRFPRGGDQKSTTGPSSDHWAKRGRSGNHSPSLVPISSRARASSDWESTLTPNPSPTREADIPLAETLSDAGF